MSDRDEAAAYLADIVQSPRVRDRAIHQILAHRFLGYGILMLLVPAVATQPIDVRVISQSSVMQMSLFDSEDVAV